MKGFDRHPGLGHFLVREILSITGIGTGVTGTPGHGTRLEIEIPGDAFRFLQDPDTQ